MKLIHIVVALILLLVVMPKKSYLVSERPSTAATRVYYCDSVKHSLDQPTRQCMAPAQGFYPARAYGARFRYTCPPGELSITDKCYGPCPGESRASGMLCVS